MALALPADRISQFMKDRIRVDPANSRKICSEWLQSVLTFLQQPHVSANLASASLPSFLTDIVNVASPPETQRALLLGNFLSSVSEGHSSPLIPDHSPSLTDVEHSIAMLRPTLIAIHDLGVTVSPDVLSHNIKHVHQLLSAVHDESMRIRLMPNHGAHSRLVAVFVSMESIMTQIQSTYVACG